MSRSRLARRDSSSSVLGSSQCRSSTRMQVGVWRDGASSVRDQGLEAAFADLFRRQVGQQRRVGRQPGDAGDQRQRLVAVGLQVAQRPGQPVQPFRFVAPRRLCRR